jgi:hypothetical protein
MPEILYLSKSVRKRAYKKTIKDRYTAELKKPSGAARPSFLLRLVSAQARQAYASYAEEARKRREVVQILYDVVCATARDCETLGCTTIIDLPVERLRAHVSMLEMAATKEPRFSLPHAWLGELHEAVGREDDASRELKTAAEMMTSFDKDGADRLSSRALALSIPLKRRKQIISRYIAESNRQFHKDHDEMAEVMSSVPLGHFSVYSDARAKRVQPVIVKAVAKKLGCTQKLVRAVYAWHCEREEGGVL